MEDKKAIQKSLMLKNLNIYRILGEITSEITLRERRLEELNTFTKPLNLTL